MMSLRVRSCVSKGQDRLTRKTLASFGLGSATTLTLARVIVQLLLRGAPIEVSQFHPSLTELRSGGYFARLFLEFARD
jgi:hypothetical protein